jgi:hypothetical protein
MPLWGFRLSSLVVHDPGEGESTRQHPENENPAIFQQETDHPGNFPDNF